MDENILSFVFDVDRSCFFFFSCGNVGCTKCGGGFGGEGGCKVVDNATTHAKERRHLAFQCLLMYTHVCPKRTFNPDWHSRLLSHAARKKTKRDKPSHRGAPRWMEKAVSTFYFGFCPHMKMKSCFLFPPARPWRVVTSPRA